MKKGINKISILFWALAVVGFISSTMHYHQDSLHCDEHESRSTVKDNESVCAVCEFIHIQSPADSQCFEIITVQEDAIFSFYRLIINKQIVAYKPDRAPPFSA